MTDYTDNFTFNFMLFGIMSSISLALTAIAIPSQRHLSKHKKKDTKLSKNNLSELSKILLKPFMIAFFIELFVLGCCVGVVERLLFVYLQNELKGNTALCGLSVGVTVLVEFPIFHYNQKIAQRLGHHGMMMTALFAYVVLCIREFHLVTSENSNLVCSNQINRYSIRSFGYTILTVDTRYYILILETLHGLTFALYYGVLLWSTERFMLPKNLRPRCKALSTLFTPLLG